MTKGIENYAPILLDIFTREILIGIAIPVIIIVYIIIIIYFSKTSSFKKWTAENRRNPMLDTAKALGFEYFKKDCHIIIKGIHKGKNIKISRFIKNQNELFVSIRISTTFRDFSKPRLFSAILFYFCLKINGLIKKWNGFENTFKISQKINLALSEKTKSNLEYLFQNGYFNFFTRLKIQPPTKALPFTKNFTERFKGYIVFELPVNIFKDINSLKIAMDIVADVAKQMDEMKMKMGR